MGVTTVQIEVQEDALKQIDAIASAQDTDRATVLREAVAQYVAEDGLLLADLEQADREIQAGDTIAHEDVLEWLEKAQHDAMREPEAA